MSGDLFGWPPVVVVKKRGLRTVRLRVALDKLSVSAPASMSIDEITDFVKKKQQMGR
jgi:predicted metal-dependent hydrolase